MLANCSKVLGLSPWLTPHQQRDGLVCCDLVGEQRHHALRDRHLDAQALRTREHSSGAACTFGNMPD